MIAWVGSSSLIHRSVGIVPAVLLGRVIRLIFKIGVSMGQSAEQLSMSSSILPMARQIHVSAAP